jgi:hypothetical protein
MTPDRRRAIARCASASIRRRKTEYRRAHKEAHGCAHCGERDSICLDLHHEDGETKSPKLKRTAASPKAYWGDLTWAELVEEIKKCVVLCANCHRKEEARLGPQTTP